ncbi:phosphotransferase [bacterium]|nr:phosphotransferase [bacterium]
MSLLLSNTQTVPPVVSPKNFDFSAGINELEELLGLKGVEVSFLAGDGSDRTYHRVLNSEGVPVAVIMKVSDQDNTKIFRGTYDWCSISTLLLSKGLTAPKILGSIPSINALVIEDFGNLMLENFSEVESTENTQKIYEKALDVIVQMLDIERDDSHVWTTRSFDTEKLSFELNFFKTHYLEKALNIDLSEKDKLDLEQEIASLSSFLADYSKYFTHRDYHSRNILIHNRKIGLIDFQDARLGPPSYDLVSLIFDPYINIGMDSRMSMYETFKTKIKDPKVLSEVQETFKPMALQRLFKAIGSFGYLTLSVKRGDYLQFVPKALEILNQIDVQDDRWPFLTETLIKRLNDVNV